MESLRTRFCPIGVAIKTLRRGRQSQRYRRSLLERDIFRDLHVGASLHSLAIKIDNYLRSNLCGNNDVLLERSSPIIIEKTLVESVSDDE